MIFLRPYIYPEGIRTQIVCSSGRCNDHFATPPGLNFHFLERALFHKVRYNFLNGKSTPIWAPSGMKQSPDWQKFAECGHPGASVLNQGCQMVCFQTKNPNLDKFWRALE
jgi:hypothetical protein